MRFIDGLKDDIRSIVLIQRPQDLDSAFVLAALQEEVADSSRKKGVPQTGFPSIQAYSEESTTSSFTSTSTLAQGSSWS